MSKGSCCRNIEEIGDFSERHPLVHLLTTFLALIYVVYACWRDIFLVNVVGSDKDSIHL